MMPTGQPLALSPDAQLPTAGIPAPVVHEEYEDYFGFAQQVAFTLPDGRQQIFFAVMNEGAKTRYQQKINKDIHINQQTRDSRIKIDPAGDRHALLDESIVGWSLKKRHPNSGEWLDVPFSKGSPGSELSKWLGVANPAVIEKLEDAIRKANPWMQDDMTAEQIDAEIDRLSDLKKQVIEKTAKEAAFS